MGVAYMEWSQCIHVQYLYLRLSQLGVTTGLWFSKWQFEIFSLNVVHLEAILDIFTTQKSQY